MTTKQRLPAWVGIAAFAGWVTVSTANAQSNSFRDLQTAALELVVYVEARGCGDNQPRGGSGFVFERSGQIITAHHVIGGCSSVYVTYPQSLALAQRRLPASAVRVYASGDLALLQVSNPPATRVLKRAALPPDKSKVHAALGYQNGEISAEELDVTFSPSPETRLNAFLPAQAQGELSRSGSYIDMNREVLRFNRPLEPGMSGGPIIDPGGSVIGIVAGGLKAGSAPASWGWPADWITNLLVSGDPTNTAISIAGTFFTLQDLATVSSAIKSGRSIKCGNLDFSYHGRRSYLDVAPGSDDQQRLQIIAQKSSAQELAQYQFDVWRHDASGATALMPAGYEISTLGAACVARSTTGPFQQILWGTPAQQAELQAAAQSFEAGVMLPRAPYQLGWGWDFILTKFALDPNGRPNLALGPISQTRSDGFVFTRKGFIHWKTQLGGLGPTAESFETLAGRSGSFMGVGTINDDVPPQLGQCFAVAWAAPGCNQMHAFFNEWMHFVLSTQLSTYPVF